MPTMRRRITVGGEFPILVAVGTKAVGAIIVILVGEAHRDPVFREGPQLLDQAADEFACPFPGKNFP